MISMFALHRRQAVLVETLIAVALLAVAMTSLVQFAIRGTERSMSAQQRSQAALLAQEKTEEILRARSELQTWEKRAETLYPVDETNRGRFLDPEEREDFRWNWAISPQEDHPGMHRITVRVFWRSPGRGDYDQKFELCTLMVSLFETDQGEASP